MESIASPLLLVITGPIGAGKSSVAELLGRRLARGGASVAIVDLDDIAFMQRGRLDLDEFWRRAGVVHGAIVAGWFEQGVDVVIAHGPFFESDSYDDLFAAAPGDGAVRHLLLDVSFDQAFERVSADPERRPDALSRNADFLRSTHDAFRERVPDLPRVDATIETTGRSVSEVIDAVLAALAPRT